MEPRLVHSCSNLPYFGLTKIKFRKTRNYKLTFFAEPTASLVPSSNVDRDLSVVPIQTVQENAFENDGLDNLLSKVDLSAQVDSNLLPEDDGLDDLLSQVDPEVFLSEVKTIDVPKESAKIQKEASTTIVASKSKNMAKAAKILEAMSLQNCNVTINL